MFNPGHTVITNIIEATMEEARGFRGEVFKAMNRYVNSDWGNVSSDSKILNDEAVKTGEDRILAVYPTSQGEIWIMTDWEEEKPLTTILFADEY